MKKPAGLLVALAVIGFLWWLAPGGPVNHAVPVSGLPWQVEVLPGGSARVFGLTLGDTTLGEAFNCLGGGLDVAVVARGSEAGALEAYLSDFSAGPLTGKLVLGVEAEAGAVARYRERATKSAYMDSGARRFTLHPDDLKDAQRARIAAITFIPSANLDAETALKRFGAPSERVRAGEHAEHLLYPHLGLDLLLDAKGKEVLQYVAPREFERLRAPLHRGSGTGDRDS